MKVALSIAFVIIMAIVVIRIVDSVAKQINRMDEDDFWDHLDGA